MSAQSDLDRLIRGEGLVIAVQPIVSLGGRHAHAYEALARFHAGSTTSPLHWFALADEFGRRDELELACVRAGLALLPQRPPGTWLSINLSGGLLLDPRLEELLAISGPLTGLILEVTENSLLDDTPGLHARISELIGRGVRFAIDDMGAGYPGLRQLITVRPSYLKLDRSLVRGIDTDADRGALVSAMLGYARQTGGHLVAEGVETEAELDTLKQLGVDLVQGFHLARPGPPWPSITDPASAAGVGSGGVGRRRALVCARGAPRRARLTRGERNPNARQRPCGHGAGLGRRPVVARCPGPRRRRRNPGRAIASPTPARPCLFPYPDNRFTRSDRHSATGVRVAMPAAAMPVNAHGARIAAGPYDRNDGFSPGSAIVLHIPGLDSPAALNRTGAVPLGDLARAYAPRQPILLLDEATGRRQLIWAELDANAPNAATRDLIIHPARNLSEGHTYVVVLRSLRTARGVAITAPGWFARLRSGARLPARRAQAARSLHPDLRDTAPRARRSARGL